VPRDVLIVLDEAYAEFVTDAASVEGGRVRAVLARPNIVMLRTFSKAYGLAGLRVGYAIGHTRVLDAARSTAIPLSVTAAGEAAALASLDAESDRLVDRLRESGWDVPDAQGNFVWLAAGERTLEVAAAFEEAGLIVRPFAGDGIRISIGEEESLDRVVEVAAATAPRRTGP
jgi:histidinol-phosphate aminotransferase